MTQVTNWEPKPGTEADWRADLRVPLLMTSDRVEWLRLHRIEQGDRCHYCTAKFAGPFGDPLLQPTLDHFIAKGVGGEHSFENTVAACWLCNTAKGDMIPEQARELLPHRRVELLQVMERKKASKKRNMKRRRARARKRLQGATEASEVAG